MRKLGRTLILSLAGLAIALITLLIWAQTLPDADRAAPAGGGDKGGPAAAPGVASVRTPDHGGPLAVPVAGVARAAITDSWEDPRENGARQHHGTDIMAPGGTPVTAAAPGTIEKLFQSDAGGMTLYVRSPDRRWTYYYAHLSGYAPGVHEGQVVKTGDPLGYVGDTGNAGAGNFHLHFGLAHTTPEQHWYEGQDVDPYPYLAGKPASR